MSAAVLELPADDVAQPTIRLEYTTTGHEWLQYTAQDIGVYNCFDVIVTALAYPKLLELLDAAKNRAYYRKWFGSVTPLALKIQRGGFGHLDKARMRAYKKLLDSQLREIDEKILSKVSLFDEMRAEAEAWRVADEAADWAAARAKNAARKKPKPDAELAPTRAASRQKRYESKLRKADERREKFLNSRGENGMLATWLFGEMGFKPAPKAKKRPLRSTAKAALMFIYEHLRKKDAPNKWILEDLFHRSRLNTIRSRYLGFPVGRDNRVYPRIRLYSAETFRWAYSDPPLHQWPAEIRHLIVPRDGYVFVAADYSQLEARIMAYSAKETRDIAAFEDRSRDVHAETAKDIFGLSDAAWVGMNGDVRKKHRNYAKKKRYEIGYGASELGAAVQELFCPCPRCIDKVPQLLSLSPEQNRNVAKRWAVTRQRTMDWRENLYTSSVAAGRVWRSPWGYTRRFAAPARDMRNSCFNCPMQSGAAEIINAAALRLDALGWTIVLQMHDELILEVPKERADEAAAALRAEMERPIPELGGVVFPAEVHIGTDWGELK